MRRELPLALGVLALTAALVLGLQRLLDVPLVGVDDANIFLTYARHLVAGEGFVYSAGGERVEGFTSLLWVLACAAALALPGPPERWLLAASALLAAAAVAGLASFLRRDALGWGRDAGGPAPASAPASVAGARLGAPLASLLALGWCFGAPSFLAWTTLSLMDTGLHCAVLTLGTLATARAAAASAAGEGAQPARTVAAFVALAQLVRPEGLALGLAWVAWLALAGGLGGRGARVAWRCAGPAALAWLVAAAALLAFRLAYFGYPLPNTFYAKVSPSLAYGLGRGLAYLASFAIAQPAAVLALVAAAAFLARSLARLGAPRSRAPGAGDPDAAERARAAAWLAVSGTALLGVAIPVAEGGDHFAMFRSFQPVWPLLGAPALALAARAPSPLARGRGGAAAAAAVALALVAVLAVASHPRWTQLPQAGHFRNEFALAQSGRAIGEALNRIQGGAPRASVGVAVAGGIGFRYRGEVVDLLGLNHVAMGHSPGERRGLVGHAAFSEEVFYRLAPDLVFPDGTLGLDPGPIRRALRPKSFENRVLGGLLLSERFRELYQPVVLGRGNLERPGQLNVAAWCRRDAIDELRATGATVVSVRGR